jgi:hypothetical protein
MKNHDVLRKTQSETVKTLAASDASNKQHKSRRIATDDILCDYPGSLHPLNT